MAEYTIGKPRYLHRNVTSPIAYQTGNTIEGVRAWARLERTGEYVRVYEYISNVANNFDTIEEAKKYARIAYRWINKPV